MTATLFPLGGEDTPTDSPRLTKAAYTEAPIGYDTVHRAEALEEGKRIGKGHSFVVGFIPLADARRLPFRSNSFQERWSCLKPPGETGLGLCVLVRPSPRNSQVHHP